MLTEEQIKNLKPGDTVLVEAEVASRLEYGAIVTHGCITHALLASKLYPLPSEHGTSVPTPKHDPCRLFKKGDKVRIVEYKGRSYSKYWEKRLGQILTVTWSEDENTSPEVDEQTIDPAYIELVTPVEEREPYIMPVNAPSNSIEVRDKRTNKVEAAFYFGKDHAYTFEQAATRAEAERDRLNSEWRKEQNHD